MPLDAPIPALHPLLANRFSPRYFVDAVVADAELRVLLEAARWAPSCYNEQPWRFMVARKQEPAEFEKLFSCVVEGNRRWASEAALLLLGVAHSRFGASERNNAHAWHDLGQATSQLTLQAGAMGLGVHQMAGFDADKARHIYGIPLEFTPVTVIAIGQAERLESLPLEARERALRSRVRLPQCAFVFCGNWGCPF